MSNKKSTTRKAQTPSPLKATDKKTLKAKEKQLTIEPKKNTSIENIKVDEPAQIKSKLEEKKSEVAAKTQTTESNTSSNDEEPKKPVTFSELGLEDILSQSCATMGWTEPSDIQREVLPHALAGKDIIGLAQTGSGKTGAFALPILQALLANPQGLFALVLSPVRELAFQISEQFEALGASIGVKSLVIVGGVDYVSQAIALAKKPHIIVATPGRIVWHLQNTKGFDLKPIKYLVFDEADRLLNMDYEEEMNTILAHSPKDRKTFLFSATMTSKVRKLRRASLNDPVKVEVSSKYSTVAGLVQNYVFVPEKFKDCYFTFLLNEFSGNSIIVFTGTCNAAQRLALMVRNLGFPAIPLHGKMSQSRRIGSLNQFKSGKRNILIATDVASRGLDIPEVDLIINYDIPAPKDYIHRVGRTARAKRAGRAISIITQYSVEPFQKIEFFIGLKLDLYPTEQDEVLLLQERVMEAQRFAAMELREAGWTKRKGLVSGTEEENDSEVNSEVQLKGNKRPKKHFKKR